MEISVLVWTCIIVFIATAAITLLSIIGKIKIPDGYRDKLFYLLIVEIVTVGVLAFKNFIKEESDDESIVRVVTPTSSITQLVTKGVPFYVFGFCEKSKFESVSGKLKIKDKFIELTNPVIDNRGVFSSSFLINDSLLNERASLMLQIIDNDSKKIIAADTTIISITTK